MDLKDIRQIVELMDEHSLSCFHLEQKGFTLKLTKGVGLLEGMPVAHYPMQAQMMPAAQAVQAAAPSPAPAAAPAPEGEEMVSPMVGTFYRKASPEATVFVNVGDQVSEGQTLCIIEAMKVMNEIKAEKSGSIVAILVDDAKPVQYGDPLFRIK